MLFNPKLSELEFVNHAGGKVKSFSIKREEETDYEGLAIFIALIKEEGKEGSRFTAAYMRDEESFSTVAVPVEINKCELHLLETNNKYPKIFKEFPLIGSKDHGLNFVFNSKRFYPNETRSDLLLNQIEGRFSQKAQSNWSALEVIFSKGLELYEKLAEVIRKGQ